mmetsp:Transcript_10725/g.36366  ORF Transcript_10725/g.36366 Transcript_10725/m.36366 type:complete len:296 (+) Transcript_10725:40-927(+)
MAEEPSEGLTHTCPLPPPKLFSVEVRGPHDAQGSTVELPCEVLSEGRPPLSSAGVGAVLTHGLGSRAPHERTHRTDSYVTEVLAPGALTAGVPAVWYTARGHGTSTGWEASASAGGLSMFTWDALSSDMLQLATATSFPRFIACGNSMGSATSLWAAARAPERVAGVVMVRAPTAWDTRMERRGKLLRNAARAAEAFPDRPAARLVLEGAALADLPPEGDPEGLYAAVACPVLLLSIEGDAAHPTSTARRLRELLPRATLHVAPDADAAKAQWPAIVADFIRDVAAAERRGAGGA